MINLIEIDSLGPDSLKLGLNSSSARVFNNMKAEPSPYLRVPDGTGRQMVSDMSTTMGSASQMREGNSSAYGPVKKHGSADVRAP
jgi:hypothetical protein